MANTYAAAPPYDYKAAAQGVSKTVTMAREIAPGQIGGLIQHTLRRISSDLSLGRDAYQSQEINPSQQVYDSRLGTRRVQGTFSGELSPGNFVEIFQSIMRAMWVPGPSFSAGAVSLTIPTTPVQGAVGQASIGNAGMIEAGFNVNDMVAFQNIPGAAGAALNNNPFRLTALTDASLQSVDLPLIPGAQPFSAGNIVVKAVGSKIYVPPSGAIFPTYAIEHWFSDIGASELFHGCVVSALNLTIPVTGMVTFSATLIGQDMTPSNTQQLLAGVAPLGFGGFDAVSGAVSIAGVDSTIITGASISVTSETAGNPVVGNLIIPFIYHGMLRVSGSFTAMFSDESILSTFINETEFVLTVTLRNGPVGAQSSNFFNIVIPRCKITASTKSDSSMMLTQQFSFQALQNVTDTTHPLTTISFQQDQIQAQ